MIRDSRMKIYCLHCGTRVSDGGGRCPSCGMMHLNPLNQAPTTASGSQHAVEAAPPAGVMGSLRAAASDCVRRPYVFLLPILIVLANEAMLQSVLLPGAGMKWVNSSSLFWVNVPVQSLPIAGLAQLPLAVQQIGLPVVSPTAVTALLWPFGGAGATAFGVLLIWITSAIRAVLNALQWRIQLHALRGSASFKSSALIWFRLFFACILLSLPAPALTWMQTSVTGFRALVWLNPSAYLAVQLGFSVSLVALATLGMAFSIGGKTNALTLWAKFYTAGRGSIAILSSAAILWSATVLIGAAAYIAASGGGNAVGSGMWAAGIVSEILSAILGVWVCQMLLRIFVNVDLMSGQPIQLVNVL